MLATAKAENTILDTRRNRLDTSAESDEHGDMGPNSLIAQFKGRVETFLVETGMGAARFGELACKDRTFVSDLRSGKREPRVSTIEKVDEFMRTWPSQAAA